LLEALDLADQIVGSADDGDAALGHGVETLLGRAGLGDPRQRADLMVVVEEVAEAEHHVASRLLARLGDVAPAGDAPAIAGDVLSVLRGRLLDDAPVVGESAEASLRRRRG